MSGGNASPSCCRLHRCDRLSLHSLGAANVNSEVRLDWMSALGQKQTHAVQQRMPALPPKSGHSRIRSLPARSGNKAPDLCPAFVVLVWPYDGEPKFVWCSYQRIGWHLDPLAIKSHSIFAVLRIPIHILDDLAIGERAAKSSPACKAFEPPLERRVFIFSIEVAGKS